MSRPAWASCILSILALLLLLPVLAGAQGTEDPPEEASTAAEPSGFLGDYSDLEPHPKKGEDLLVYRKAEGVLAHYDQFLIENPLIYFRPDAKGVGVDPEELKMLADFLRQAVVEQLDKGGYRIVEEAGPGVLRVRSAITDVNPVNPASNIGSKVAGAALGVGLLVPRVDLGGASIEVEMLDGESGERVAAVVAQRRARRLGGLIKGSKRWGDVKAAFKSWAKMFRKRLDQSREEG